MRGSIKSLILAWGLSLAAQSSAAVEIRKEGGTTVYDVRLDGVNFRPVNIGGKDFVEATLAGAGKFGSVKYELGKPELPVIRFFADGDVKVTSANQFAEKALTADKPIKPSQVSWSKSQKFLPPVSYDAAAYSVKGFTSDPAYTIEKAGSYRGVTRYLVTLNPLRYNAVDGSVRLRGQFKVTVTKPSLAEESGAPTLALVVGAKFKNSPALRELIQLKQSQGFRVRQIDVGVNGVTTDVGVRQALKALYAERVNLRFATLIGDHDDVPSHRATHISGMTDHFYRAIDTDNYESDLNGPDIGVGRISVASEQQLAVVVGKIRKYIDGRFASDHWMSHPAFVTTHDRWQVAEGTHNAVVAQHFAPRSYNRVFPDANEKGGDKLFPITFKATPSQIVNHMKSGRFIINYSGHGSHTGWEDVTTADVNSLNDPNALPWVIGNACITADFTEEPVFGETWLRQPNGAIMYWGSFDSSYWDEDDILEKGMYNAVFAQNTRSFDMIHQAALSEVWRYYGGANRSSYYWETYVTLGDPSLELRVSPSAEPQVEGPDALVVGATEAAYRVSVGGQPAQGVAVTLTRPSDGQMISGRSNAQGEVVLPLAAFGESVEPLRLTVTGSDIKQFSRDLAVIAPDRPHLGFSAWTVNGRAAGGVQVGETVRLGAQVENFGMVATSGGEVRLVSISGASVVSGQTAAVPALSSRQKGPISGGIAFLVGQGDKAPAMIQARFEWRTKEGQSGVFSQSWPLIKANVEVSAVEYTEPGVEGINGEGDVFVTVRNSGNETIRDGIISASPGACTRVVTGSFVIAELAPGATFRAPSPLRVATDGQCQNGARGMFNISGTYANGMSRVNISAPATYTVGQLMTEVEKFEGLGLVIPDGKDQVVKSIQMNGSGAIKDVSVYVRIDHTYVGDLEVRLVAPSGKSALLHNRSGGSTDQLVQRWGRGGMEVAELAQLVGDEARGEWKIVIKDLASQDAGTLQDVELVLRHW